MWVDGDIEQYFNNISVIPISRPVQRRPAILTYKHNSLPADVRQMDNG